MAQSLSKMAKVIQSLGRRHGTYSVFADFCEMSALAFSNAVDKPQFEKREARYMTVIKKYSREELDEFPKLIAMLAEELQLYPSDVLGALFHELELHNEHAGQFFTPFHLCEMIAKMTFDEGAFQTIKEVGHITLQEPACGAGAMVIGFAKAMLSRELNYQQCLHVSAIDIDIRCVHMAYTQFSLLNIPAVVYAGNTLTLEIREAWYTPAHIMGGWDWRLNKPDKPVPLPTPIEQIVEAASLKPKPKTAKSKAQSNQLSIF